VTPDQVQAVAVLAHPHAPVWGAVIGGAFIAACVFYTCLHVFWALVRHLRPWLNQTPREAGHVKGAHGDAAPTNEKEARHA